MFHFPDDRWGITYLLPDGRLSDEEKVYLFSEATKMYLLNGQKNIRNDTLEGRI